jgi:acetamidase/formamidase
MMPETCPVYPRSLLNLCAARPAKRPAERAETPTHWIVKGLSPNLDEAIKMAVRETIGFIPQRFPKLTREEA